MEDIYHSLELSRQAHHKQMHKQKDNGVIGSLINRAETIRVRHPRMGCRKIARRIRVPGFGRDKTERLLMHRGFRIARKRKYVKTTQSQREIYFPNLIEGLVLNGKNQLIQTDITYFSIGENHYYIVFIIDVYTRMITGYNVSNTLKATENIKALQKAIKLRCGDDLRGMIHHSDKGSQYINNQYLDLLKNHGIQVSMCDYAWENAYGERINRTIKEEYLEAVEIKNFRELKKHVSRAVHLYNQDRGHKNLFQEMSPVKFEQHLLTIEAEQYPAIKLHSPDKTLLTKMPLTNKEKK